MQREVLNGSVHLDPHPEQRNTLRTQDIQDPAQAKQFMRTQIAKHMEHYLASNGRPKIASVMKAGNQPPSSTVSPSRISELRGSTILGVAGARKQKRKRAAGRKRSAA